MPLTPRSARSSQKSLFPEEESTPVPERSESAREELRRIIIGTGRQKGVGIQLFGVSSGETRISRALSPRGSSDSQAFDVDDALSALAYLRSEIGEAPVAEFMAWLGEELGYTVHKVEPLTMEQRLELLEEQEAEDARLEAALLRNKQRRRNAVAALRREVERKKDGVR